MISIVIPTYQQPGHGGLMLIVLLNSIRHQQIKCKYEIVISDNDSEGVIKNICKRFYMLPIRYKYNPVKGASENFNHGIDMAKGDKVKLMCMDDAFTRKDSIDIFNDALDQRKWVISNSLQINHQGDVRNKMHTRYNHSQMQSNITGMPSVVGFRKCDIRFDPRLKTFCDTYFYYQLYELYGQPLVIQEFSVGCRFWKGSLSANQPNHKNADLEFMRKNRMIKC